MKPDASGAHRCPSPSRPRRVWPGFTLALVCVAALGGGCPSRQASRPAPTPQAAKDDVQARLTIFYTSAIGGTLEPCGCNSDPLGGVDRYASLVRAASAQGPVLLVDGGNMLFSPNGVPALKRDAAKLRAAFVAERLTALGLAGSALGPADLVAGAEFVKPPRLATNASPPTTAHHLVTPSRLETRGSLKVGVMGVVAADVAEAAGVPATDPVGGARDEAARLRAAGADLVVAVAAIDRPLARKVARAAEIDILVLGTPSEEGMSQADFVEGTFIVAAAAELQKAGRIDVVLRKRAGTWAPLVDAGSPEALAARRDDVNEQVAALAAQLARWKRDTGADPDFVAAREKDLLALRAEAQALAGQTFAPPAEGSYLVNQLVPIRRALPQDAQVTAAMRTLDQAIGKLNLAAATAPPPAVRGRAHYVGDASCARCHQEELAFWKTTVHAQGWKTLVDGGKEADLECVGCHVTGYGQVGGSALGFTKGLEAIQCEVCHGPGSLHVAEEGLDEPPTVHSETPESTCVQCHNEKHSDTFAYEAYLRDIVGPGHGEAARKALGEGPTGGELRRAAMAKAQAAGKAQVGTH